MEEIRFKAKFDKFLTEKKNEIMDQKKKIKEIIFFSICNNKLLYGDRVAIPAVLTKKILKDFYTGHPGISRMKTLMRSYIY